MKKDFTSLLLIVLIAAISSCSDDTEPNQQIDYVSADQFLEDVEFSGSVLIQKDGQDILRKGYGLANRANHVQNHPDLIYRIGSVTKSFTAAAIVNLKREGLIESFDQALSDFSDDFPQGDLITIRHLLTHHSGIPDYVGPVESYADANNYYFDPEEIMDVITESIEEDGLDFTPGEFFAYSNSNYFILGLLIEELTGKSFEEYLDERVFEPLDLSDSGKGPDEIADSERAQGYDQGIEAVPYQMQIAFSAGELESSISDLENWTKALMSDYLTETEKEEVFAAPFGEDGYNTVGFGWFTLNIENQVVYHHGGDINGFTSLVVMIPQSEGLIILLSNEQDQGDQRNRLMEAIIKNEFNF